MSTATKQQTVVRQVTVEETVDLPEIPVITGMQAQGDLIIIPWPEDVSPERRARDAAAVQPIEKTVVVLTGENGHDHALSPAPGVHWGAYVPAGQTLGVLKVDEGSVGVLGHIEHGDSYVGPGLYVIRRQREMADEIRFVAD